MTCWAVIPVKGPAQAKMRLAAALDEAQRADLAHAMLERVVSAARAAKGVDRVLLLGPSRLGLPDALPLLTDPGYGLNAAVQSALAEVSRSGVSRVIFIAGDLPGLTAEDMERLAAQPEGTIAIAPDRHGTGTNALSLPLPAAEDFQFAFGPGSFALHGREAGRLGLTQAVVRSKGLAQDIDEPDDLADALGLIARPA